MRQVEGECVYAVGGRVEECVLCRKVWELVTCREKCWCVVCLEEVEGVVCGRVWSI